MPSHCKRKRINVRFTMDAKVSLTFGITVRVSQRGRNISNTVPKLA